VHQKAPNAEFSDAADELHGFHNMKFLDGSAFWDLSPRSLVENQ
jgi:hypothetical protein